MTLKRELSSTLDQRKQNKAQGFAKNKTYNKDKVWEKIQNDNIYQLILIILNGDTCYFFKYIKSNTSKTKLSKEVGYIF